jgi:hypothetical protein
MFTQLGASHAQFFAHTNHHLRRHSAGHETEIVGPKNTNEDWCREWSL